MEPLFFKAENLASKKIPCCADQHASMEPLFFKAENSLPQSKVNHQLTASMEPLFFKAENIPPIGASVCRTRWLQWSRFFSKRKMEHVPGRKTILKTWLQWSRFFSKRKMYARIVPVAPVPVASMEPLFFKAENRKGTSLWASRRWQLQWSRFFSKRKIA